MSAVSYFRATKQPPFHLKQAIPFEEYTTVRITHTFTNATTSANETRKLDVPFCPDSSDKERLVRCIHEYIDACDTARLHCSDADRYTHMRDILGGDLRTTWDTVAASRTTKNDANFLIDIRKFMANYVPSNAFLIEQEYFNTAKKPYNLDCYSAVARLRLINTLCTYLPGSSGAELFPNPTAVKNAFYKMMLPEWQLKFDGTGNLLDDNTYSLQNLVNFMEQCRLFHDAQQAARRSRPSQYQGNNNNHRARSFQPYPAYPSPSRFNPAAQPNPYPNRFPSQQLQRPQGSPAHNIHRQGFRQKPRSTLYRNSPSSSTFAGHGRGTPGGRGRAQTFRSPYATRSRTQQQRGSSSALPQRRLYGYAGAPPNSDTYFNQDVTPSNQNPPNEQYIFQEPPQQEFYDQNADTNFHDAPSDGFFADDVGYTYGPYNQYLDEY